MKVTKNINMQNNCVRVYMNISIYVFPHAHTMATGTAAIVAKFQAAGRKRGKRDRRTNATLPC